MIVQELSRQQLLVLVETARGGTNWGIGAKLGLTTDEVKDAQRAIFRRLGAVDRANAVAIGYETGILPLDTLGREP